MRSVVLAVFAILAGCSTTPEPGRTTRSATPDPRGEQRVLVRPVVGATVEDARHPGVMYCAKCGTATDARGACRCNRLGLPGYGLDPASRVRHSTSPR